KIAAGTGPTSCEAKATINGPRTNGRLCEAPPARGGCGATQVCTPTLVGSLGSCVTKLGANACPAGFANKNTAGTNADDKRMCGGCKCSPPTPCGGGSVSVYNNDGCRTNGMNKGAVNI